MLRSFKYGAYAAALAGVVGGTVAFTSAGHDKIVHLLVDGQPRSVQTQASDVSGAIKDAGFTVGAHDLVAPAANSTVTNGETVVYRRGRLLHLSVDGQAKEVWTTAPTVALALTALGYSSEDFTSVSRSRRLPLGATDIALRTPKRVTVSHDGKRSTVTTTDASVAQLLSDLSLRVGPYDRLSAAGTTPLVNGATIALTRVQHRAVVKTTSIPFPTRSIKDASMYAGSTKIVTPGRTGLARVSYAIVFVNGKRVGTVSYHRDVLRTPRTQVQKVGAKSTVPPYTGSPSSAQSIARAMMQRDYGWGDSEFSCLVQMWDRESGWRTDASNPSGAYGIPQALPGSKMSSAGPNWESNATTQIRWGLRYIASRYNTPCQAWGLWQQQGWY